MLGVTANNMGGVWYVAGRLDEHADLDALLAAPAPLLINLRRLQSINSLGLLRWLKFVTKLGKRQVEFHECPVVFLEVMAQVVSLLSPDGSHSRLVSAYLPYSCESGHAESFVVTVAEIDAGAPEPVGPPRICARCGGASRQLHELGDLLGFLGDR